MFIQTEDTPNPNTMKFLPSRTILGDRAALSFARGDDLSASPLAAALFELDGIDNILLAPDFLTVTRLEGQDWNVLRPLVLEVLMNHFLSDQPILADDAAPVEACSTIDDAIVIQIKDLLDTRVRPAIAQDGGDIAFVRFEEGIVYLRLRGACAGCPGATATLKMGVERLLRYYIPEVQEVRQVL